ncbi:MAG: hypothetical protein F6J87_31130 [Spirulina sp. SIO3F2]|nr:hypothetical protein [Spirulina sp. SIO3F2]
MVIVLCPGIHPPEVTESFRRRFTPLHSYSCLVIPETIAPYNGPAIANFVCHHCDRTEPLLFMGFSAGVVGAVFAAHHWQQQGGQVLSLWAWDGWGVPLAGSFPTVRVSHDYFTHWSSGLLGQGDRTFWADPPIEHLELWRRPDQVMGWQAAGWGLQVQEPLSLNAFGKIIIPL